MTPAEMLDKLERGRIGHGKAMHWLGVDSCNELAEIVHYNGPTDGRYGTQLSWATGVSDKKDDASKEWPVAQETRPLKEADQCWNVL